MVKLNRDGSLIGNPGRSFARVKGVRLKASFVTLIYLPPSRSRRGLYVMVCYF